MGPNRGNGMGDGHLGTAHRLRRMRDLSSEQATQMPAQRRRIQPPRPGRDESRGGVQLRSMREEDLSFVVGEHLQHFPRGFFARLGPRFLHEYYRAFLTGETGVAVVAEEAGRPVGYLVGVTDPAAHREHVVRRHGRGLALRGAALLVVRPRLLAGFLRTRAGLYLKKLLVRRAARSGRSVAVAPPAVLTHVAVAAQAQGKGIGTLLVEWFEHALESCGCDRVVLVTAAGREGAGQFYERRGWTRTGEHATADGHLLSNYEYRFDDTRGVVQA